MVKNHKDNERENLLVPLHELLFLISSKGTFICITAHRQDSTYHGLCSTCGALVGMGNSSMGPPGGIGLMTYHTIYRQAVFYSSFSD